MIDYEKYRQMLNRLTPRYAGKVFPIDGCPVPLIGESIKQHLEGSGSVLVCAVTLGEEFDRLLRRLQLEDMAGAVILDQMAGDYLDEVCDKFDSEIMSRHEDSRYCWRFSPGYGDFPLSVSRDIIDVLEATKKIGLCITDEFILTPQKSITGIVGIL
ncbi:MAG: hypothetical protein FWG83_03980 [Oscillospiraceae bacterium]|nr:hypothetical protein [Oscillospiraceae bacterium]